MLPFRVGRQVCSYAFTERRTPLLAQRHRIGRGRRLAAEERRPVVVEVAEDGRYVDSAYLDVIESGTTEEVGQRFRPAQRETAPFVQLPRSRVQLSRRVPEVAHHLHALGVVPDVGGDGSARTRHARHLLYGLSRLRHEVENESGDYRVEGCWIRLQNPRVPGVETDPWIPHPIPRESHERRRWVYAHNLPRGSHR